MKLTRGWSASSVAASLGKYLLAGLMLCLARKSCSRPFSIRFWRRDFFLTSGTLRAEHRHMRVGSRRERRQELFGRPRRSWAKGRGGRGR